jgi:hypothetical protein
MSGQEQLKMNEIRDLGGINPRGEMIQAIYENFEMLFNEVNELRNEKTKKMGRPRKEA